MSSSSFPDVNLWLALAAPEHVHAGIARAWWEAESGHIAFSRVTQPGLLRLVTTSVVMDGKPLTMLEAWTVYDRFFEDDRVVFVPETDKVEFLFRSATADRVASPKIWADAWLLALAKATGGTLVTFDSALANRGAQCLLPNR